MKHEFWKDVWDEKRIAFHNPDVHPMLAAHIGALKLAEGARIFLPLCGKTLDIHWLLKQGYRVCGAELVETAVQELFEELGVTPEIKPAGKLKHYHAKGLDIFVGDIFKLDAGTLGPVDAVYDRASLVALPPDMRVQYTAQLAAQTGGAPQLLITFEYDQSEMDGPPFSVPDAEIRDHYQAAFDITHLESRDVEGGLKGLCRADENAWLLLPQEGDR